LCGESSEKIYKATDCKNAIFTTTLEEATRVAYNLAEPKDRVILSPASASFDMFENYCEKSKAYRKAINTLK
jgi:UDP-N-acetylmuramoylalanine--D-glutamate ligase